MENFKYLTIEFWDWIIILIISFKLIFTLRGTRAMNIVRGFAVGFVVFLVAKKLNLTHTALIFQTIFDNWIIVVLFLFQEEFKSFFANFGRKTNIIKKKTKTPPEIINIIADTVFALSKNHLGALIVIEENDPLDNYKESGEKIDANISKSLLYTLFTIQSRMHDGAVIISKNSGRIESAGCFLPLTKDHSLLEKKFGTRHRAAMGLSEQTDAIIILVSEESSEVKIFHKGIYHVVKKKEDISKYINNQELSQPINKMKKLILEIKNKLNFN